MFFAGYPKICHIFTYSCASTFPFDVSPGYKQSSLAAKKVLQQLANSGAPPVTTIYSSPTARTLGTAAAMAQEVGVSRVLPAYGLNCCAAAKMTGEDVDPTEGRHQYRPHI